MNGPGCYSRWSFSVTLILRLKRTKKKTERINTNRTEQATAAEIIPALLLFVPAYIKHVQLELAYNCDEFRIRFTGDDFDNI